MFEAMIGSLSFFMLANLYLYKSTLSYPLPPWAENKPLKKDRVGGIAFNYEIVYYKTILYFLDFPSSPAKDTRTPYFKTIHNQWENQHIKEKLVFFPERELNFFTFIFKTKKTFPTSTNPFFNTTISIQLMMNVKSISLYEWTSSKFQLS
jgi:hypothetical protein